MNGALIALFIVICYKARQGELEEDIIKGTRIYGSILLSISLLIEISSILMFPEECFKSIIALIESVILLIILINIKRMAEKILYKEDEWKK